MGKMRQWVMFDLVVHSILFVKCVNGGEMVQFVAFVPFNNWDKENKGHKLDQLFPFLFLSSIAKENKREKFVQLSKGAKAKNWDKEFSFSLLSLLSPLNPLSPLPKGDKWGQR